MIRTCQPRSLGLFKANQHRYKTYQTSHLNICFTTLLNMVPALAPPEAAPSPDVVVLSTVVVVAPSASMVTLFVVLVTSISALADPWNREHLLLLRKMHLKLHQVIQFLPTFPAPPPPLIVTVFVGVDVSV